MMTVSGEQNALRDPYYVNGVPTVLIRDPLLRRGDGRGSKHFPGLPVKKAVMRPWVYSLYQGPGGH